MIIQHFPETHIIIYIYHRELASQASISSRSFSFCHSQQVEPVLLTDIKPNYRGHRRTNYEHHGRTMGTTDAKATATVILTLHSHVHNLLQKVLNNTIYTYSM